MSWWPVGGCTNAIGGANARVIREALWYVSNVGMVVDGELSDRFPGEGTFGKQGTDGFGLVNPVPRVLHSLPDRCDVRKQSTKVLVGWLWGLLVFLLLSSHLFSKAQS